MISPYLDLGSLSTKTGTKGEYTLYCKNTYYIAPFALVLHDWLNELLHREHNLCILHTVFSHYGWFLGR